MNRIIVPLDVPSAAEALELVECLGPGCDFYKVGLELFTREGPAVVHELRRLGKRVFLDLKLLDIPHTVARSVAAAVDLEVELLTVHASGGSRMLEAAVEARRGDLRLLGVTVLTSLTPDDMEGVWGRPIQSVRDEVGRLAELAVGSGLDGVVASALEVSWIRGALGNRPLVVTPGIRPAGTDRQDQNRVATPAEAIRAGADFLVIGRPITRADDPAQAFRAVVAEIELAGEDEG